jgi:hypothetical protein
MTIAFNAAAVAVIAVRASQAATYQELALAHSLIPYAAGYTVKEENALTWALAIEAQHKNHKWTSKHNTVAQHALALARASTLAIGAHDLDFADTAALITSFKVTIAAAKALALQELADIAPVQFDFIEARYPVMAALHFAVLHLDACTSKASREAGLEKVREAMTVEGMARIIRAKCEASKSYVAARAKHNETVAAASAAAHAKAAKAAADAKAAKAAKAHIAATPAPALQVAALKVGDKVNPPVKGNTKVSIVTPDATPVRVDASEQSEARITTLQDCRRSIAQIVVYAAEQNLSLQKLQDMVNAQYVLYRQANKR